MAFKMKNPSMAKLTKAAGDNRAAMKMKMEDKAAAKMKAESAMKMKSPMKADIPEVEVTAKKTEKGSVNRRNPNVTTTAVETKDTSNKGLTDQKKLDVMKSRVKDGQVTDRAVVRNKKTGKLSYRSLSESMDGYKVIAKPTTREGGTATKMKKASPAKQKMNMVKGPDGKMVPDFAVDGKGAGDMKSGAKMKKPMKMKKAAMKMGRKKK